MKKRLYASWGKGCVPVVNDVVIGSMMPLPDVAYPS